MIDAEKWYEYQRDYQKYGIDMQPERVRPERRKRTIVVSPATRNRVTNRKIIFSSVAIIGLLAILSIVVTAFCAGLQYDINKMNKENTAVMGEIENLQAELYAASNIDKVETTATGTLGMKYPKESKRVYVYTDDIPAEGFSTLIREMAYN